MKYYDKLIFEISKPGRIGYSLQQSDFGNYSLTDLPQSLRRETETDLPEASELDVVRHYTNVSNKNFGVETGFYPLGSCTMKYNPKINEEMASMESFTALHPLQSENSIQGALRLYYELAHALSEISGLAEFTLNPFAGAHGELTGLMLMRQYHIKRGDLKRTKVIVPDSAHGTNPASAAVCGLEIVEVPSTPEGTIDVTKLEPLLDDTIAGIMMTNPNTLGIFEKEIPQIAELVHGCGGLLYYDGANLNPLLGRCRPGDMGFDIMHINLHKTFSTPHGGGGPGSGPVGVAPALVDYLPRPRIVKKGDKYSIEGGNDSMGRISGFFGNFGVMMRAYAYILSLGKEQIKHVGELATLNANYVKESLKDCYYLPIEGICKHEFVFDGDYIGHRQTTARLRLPCAHDLFPLVVPSVDYDRTDRNGIERDSRRVHRGDAHGRPRSDRKPRFGKKRAPLHSGEKARRNHSGEKSDFTIQRFTKTIIIFNYRRPRKRQTSFSSPIFYKIQV